MRLKIFLYILEIALYYMCGLQVLSPSCGLSFHLVAPDASAAAGGRVCLVPAVTSARSRSLGSWFLCVDFVSSYFAESSNCLLVLKHWFSFFFCCFFPKYIIKTTANIDFPSFRPLTVVLPDYRGLGLKRCVCEIRLQDPSVCGTVFHL